MSASDLPHWSTRAKCRDLATDPDPVRRDLLFPAARDSKNIAKAKQFCQGCPVADECLAESGADMHSVRAGLTADERRRLRHGGAVRVCRSCGLDFVPSPNTPNVCMGCIGRHHRPMRPEDYKDEIIAMHERGAWGERISLHFGFSRDEIRNAGLRWGIALTRRPAPKEPVGHRRHGEQCTPLRRVSEATRELVAA